MAALYVAERLFGLPATSSERREGSLAVTSLTFHPGDHRVMADFIDDVLIRATMMSR